MNKLLSTGLALSMIAVMCMLAPAENKPMRMPGEPRLIAKHAIKDCRALRYEQTVCQTIDGKLFVLNGSYSITKPVYRAIDGDRLLICFGSDLKKCVETI